MDNKLEDKIDKLHEKLDKIIDKMSEDSKEIWKVLSRHAAYFAILASSMIVIASVILKNIKF